MQIQKVEQVYTQNNLKLQFISIKAIATLKVISALACGGKISMNPIDIVEEEFLKYYSNKPIYHSTIMYKICRLSLIEASKFINKNLTEKQDEIYTQFQEVIKSE